MSEICDYHKSCHLMVCEQALGSVRVRLRRREHGDVTRRIRFETGKCNDRCGLRLLDWVHLGLSSLMC